MYLTTNYNDNKDKHVCKRQGMCRKIMNRRLTFTRYSPRASMMQNFPLMSVVVVVSMAWSLPSSPTVNTCTSLKEAYTEKTRMPITHGLVPCLAKAWHVVY